MADFTISYGGNQYTVSGDRIDRFRDDVVAALASHGGFVRVGKGLDVEILVTAGVPITIEVFEPARAYSFG